MIDIGINLGNEAFDHDRDLVLERAKATGIEFIILTGSCPESNDFALNYAQTHKDYARSTAGIHPHHADTVTHDTMQTIRGQLQHPSVCAIGETGLDFFRDIADRRKQEAAFEAHLELAAETGLPLFLHQRDSHERFLPIMKHYRNDISTAVVHCFTDQKKALHDYLDLDLHIGITGWIADERRGTHLLPLLPSIPPDRLMVETDGPYLLPRNIRPKPKNRRNEPCFLPYVINKVAEARGEQLETVARFTTQTARQFFRLDSPPT